MGNENKKPKCQVCGVKVNRYNARAVDDFDNTREYKKKLVCSRLCENTWNYQEDLHVEKHKLSKIIVVIEELTGFESPNIDMLYQVLIDMACNRRSHDSIYGQGDHTTVSEFTVPQIEIIYDKLRLGCSNTYPSITSDNFNTIWNRSNTKMWMLLMRNLLRAMIHSQPIFYNGVFSVLHYKEKIFKILLIKMIPDLANIVVNYLYMLPETIARGEELVYKDRDRDLAKNNKDWHDIFYDMLTDI